MTIEELDDQHRNLFLLINRLIVHKRTHGPREEILDLIEVLVAYAQTHVRTEEHPMADTHDSLALSHRKEHREFTLTVQDFMNDYDRGVEGLSTKMLTFLRHGWVSHGGDSDQRFAKHLTNEGYLP